MAYTVTRKKTVFGNEGVVHLKITADAATQAVESGLKRIDHYNLGFGSMNTRGVAIFINSNASGVQSYGVLGISGCTSGDDLYITVYGTR